MINLIWGGMILLGVSCALVRCLIPGGLEIHAVMAEIFKSADLSVQVIIGLLGMTCLWMGIASILEASGVTGRLALLLEPLFRVIMPGIPKGHPAIGSVTMNIAANMLGLDNAATPFGIKAMKDMQTLNPKPDTATDSQIMFLVINTSAVTVFPVSIIMYRSRFGAASPTDVFLPLLLCTAFSTLVGFLVTARVQRLAVFKKPVLILFAGAAGLIAGTGVWAALAGASFAAETAALSDAAVVALAGAAVGWGMIRRVKVFEAFVNGAKQGFAICVDILPYLVGMMFAIAVFRSSGLLDGLLAAVRAAAGLFTARTEFADALPVGIMGPLSGSGARALLLDIFSRLGPDSLAGRMASLMQGSTETTFYVLTVYFGSVGITKIRHALFCGLAADLASIAAAIAAGYFFFG